MKLINTSSPERWELLRLVPRLEGRFSLSQEALILVALHAPPGPRYRFLSLYTNAQISISFKAIYSS